MPLFNISLKQNHMLLIQEDRVENKEESLLIQVL